MIKRTFVINFLLLSNNAIAELVIEREAYESKIFSGSQVTNGETNFYYNKDTLLHGDYWFNENKSKVYGDINNCQIVKNKYICKWRDKYGKGILEINFSPSKDEFLGYWGIENNIPRFRWTGKIK